MAYLLQNILASLRTRNAIITLMLAIHRVAGKEVAQQELPFKKQNHAICCPRMIGQPTFVTVGDYGLPPSVWPEIPLEVLILHFPSSVLYVRKQKTE